MKKISQAFLIGLLLVGAFILLRQIAFATDTAATSAGTGVGNTGTGSGFGAWVSPGNITASDNSFATVGCANGQSNWLTGTGFSFSIPAGATINGIVAEVEAKKTGAALAHDRSVKLIKAGVIGGQDKATRTTLTTSDDIYVTYGANNNLWGDTWTPTDINNAKFGVAITFGVSSVMCTLSVDHIRMTITYTAAAVVATQTRTAANTEFE